MELWILIVLIVYIALVILLMAGWDKGIRSRKNISGKTLSRISVIVPVRNEEQNISNLLQSLEQQSHTSYEVIIVDDHSTDRTREVIEQSSWKKVRLIVNPGHGKKSALTAGVSSAQGEIVVTTDADCRMSSEWLKCVDHAFAAPTTQLSFGAVRIDDQKSFFSQMQSMEFSSLMGSGAALANLGMPVMCNGANLAYRKKTFVEVSGYDGNLDVASGDDEFLMRKILEKYPGGVTFDGAADRVVTTTAAETIRTFVHQRLRWAGKWKHNTSFSAVAVALFVILVQFAVLAGLIFTITDFSAAFISTLVAKLLIEGLFLYRVNRFTGSRWNTLAFLTLQIVYPIYVLFIGISSNFLSFEWKGRPKGLVIPSERT